MISIKHVTLNMLGSYAMPLFVVSMDKRERVEMHLFQVRGKIQAFNGASLPSFLPKTG